jgi:hypothetical protein
MGHPKTQRAWNVPPASAAFAAVACLALSTQFLFQRTLYQEWSWAAIASAWLRSFAELVAVVAAILLALWLAGRMPIRRTPLKLLAFGAALFAGAYAGEWVVLWMQWGEWPTAHYTAILPRALRWLPIGAVAGAVMLLRARNTDLATRLHESELSRLQLDRQQLAAQVQLLQSQIEPHFLFNTIATIRRLQHTDPTRGQETLSGFIHYLRSSLPGMRSTETTLGRELALIGAYLDVLGVRMGDRLRVEIDVAPELHERRIPPLSLATLVENSIKHGLGSLPEGGTISIRAWLAGDLLNVRVADTGVGLTGSAGSGIGLANLRLRLRSLYGEAGVLQVSSNEPRGVAATLRVPSARIGDDRGDR